MDGGGLHGPPYGGVLRLYEWVRGRWWDFDGYCTDRGIDPWGLPASRFLNLVHVLWRRTLPDEPGKEGMYTKDELDRDVMGPLTELTQPPAPVAGDDDPFAVPGLEAPPWWRGDEEAAMSGLQVRSA